MNIEEITMLRNYVLRIFTVALLSLFLFSCERSKNSSDGENTNNQPLDSGTTVTTLALSQVTLTPKENTKRWYFLAQAEKGKAICSRNCAVCHGKNAEATPSWKTPNANGQYPPPPLNGTAHAWHHPLHLLGSTIYNGGAPVGGQMPAFKDQLAESDIIDVIAYFQSYWSDDIYERWLVMQKSLQ
jgi:mono/diheme cytochrome c family protein